MIRNYLKSGELARLKKPDLSVIATAAQREKCMGRSWVLGINGTANRVKVNVISAGK
jgi:hypothetical protein